MAFNQNTLVEILINYSHFEYLIKRKTSNIQRTNEWGTDFIEPQKCSLFYDRFLLRSFDTISIEFIYLKVSGHMNSL